MDDQANVSRRTARQKVDKKGRFAALAKLKELKGSKNKYEVSDLENVYEEVDEREYSKRVRERQDDDWIVDDGGGGYVEDGREIFDDDLDDESIIQASKKKKKGDHGSSKRARLSSSSNASVKGNSIHHMLLNMPSKQKEKSVNLDADDILDDIMGEINGSNSSSKDEGSDAKELLTLSSEETAQKYLKSLTKIKPVVTTKKNSTFKDNENQLNVDLPPECFPKQPSCNVEVTKTVSKSLFNNSIEECNKPVKNIPNDEFGDLMEEDFCDFKEEDFHDIKGIGDVPAKDNELVKIPEDKKELSPKVSKSQKLLEKKPIPSEDCLNFERNMTSEDLGKIFQEPFDPQNVPLVTNASNQKVFRFYCLDAQEDYSRKGIVFLFGKVCVNSANANVSCCVTVHNIERRVYLLPREKIVSSDGEEKDVSMVDVYNEFSAVASKHYIPEFRFQKIQKHNCFNPEIPTTSEYVEVKYSAEYPVLPAGLNGKTFSHVLGTSSSPLERFLIERGIKGPCWLDVQNVVLNTNRKRTWCNLEACVQKMEFVCIAQSSVKLVPPLISLLCLQIKTVANTKSNSNEVALVVGLVNQNFPLDHQPSQQLYSHNFCILAPLSDKSFPNSLYDSIKKEGLNVERVDSENALLKNLVRKINRLDPDIIVGHDILGFDLEVLIHRMFSYKIHNWSQISRLQRQLKTDVDRKKLSFTKNYLFGRLTCDVMLSAKELVQNVRSYDLETLCSTVLEKETHHALTFEEVRNHYETNEKLIILVKKSFLDAFHSLQLLCHLSAIPLALQISNIAGIMMSRTLIGGRAERNEFLLLHAFHDKNFIPPDKVTKNNKHKDDVEQTQGKGRKKPAYSGGLVLEPKVGLYDKMVLVMDFNSLYPSIIMEFNICFTTVPITSSLEEGAIPDLPAKDLDTGILPSEIHKLVESRVSVKKMLQADNLTPIEKSQYHTRQLALKLMANSMYGCLGFSNARFYAKPLAALITAKGRELLMNTKELVESLNYEVIYGDTDSIMINTNCADLDEVTKIGKQILQSVNKAYRCVKLDIDGIFKYMLLLKKKKYAVKELIRLSDGTIKTQIKHKGLDIVRRDWSRIAVESGHYIVEQILSHSPLEERLLLVEQHLEKIRKDLESGCVPLPLLTITKQLTKSVEQYQDAKSQPHVMVAKRLIKKGMSRMKAGDMVSYVICEDGTDVAPTQRAYHLDELKTDKNLKIDYKYYLAHQIHPVITRLLEPVDGIDACRIAEVLGLDPSPYQQSLRQRTHHNTEDPDDSTDLLFHNPEHYENCERFTFSCAQCQTSIVVDKPYKENQDGTVYPVLSKCSNPQCPVSPTDYLPNIQNKLTLMIRDQLHQYSVGGLICEDPACTLKTNYVPQKFHRAYPVCSMCKSAVMYKKVTDKHLYMQLYFFQLIFDIKNAREYKQGMRPSPAVEAAYSALYNYVANILEHSAYSRVDLQVLFKYCNTTARSIDKAKKLGTPVEDLKLVHTQ